MYIKNMRFHIACERNLKINASKYRFELYVGIQKKNE